MAKKIVETYTDDLDGKEATGTTRFGLDGREYEIDLSDKNEAKLRKALAPYINVARPVRRERLGRGRRGGAGRSLDREKSKAMRKWAKEHGLPVSERGRIASDIAEKYDAAH
ncbi:histone-like nucleoid-structuring protein Lsr2 [Streptosporangium sp. KLBMP 9127]|nr:Lsr2 family protein [Streptosporangium sp. KLBMP 9127]